MGYEKTVRDAISWYINTDRAVKSVGGVGAEIVIRGMSDDLLYTMVANGLMITPKKLDDKEA